MKPTLSRLLQRSMLTHRRTSLRRSTAAVIEMIEPRVLMSDTSVAADATVSDMTSTAVTFYRNFRHRGSDSTVTTPVTPTSLNATAVDTADISLAWTAGDSSAIGYYIERSTDGTTFTQIADVSTTSYTDTGLTAGTKYIYRVSAYNMAGTSTVSSTATATTPAASSSTGTTTTTVTLSGDQPSADNTGVQDGVTLTTVSSFKATSNTTYKNLNITGQVTLTGLSNVTLINCVIDATGYAYDVRCDGATGITIEHCELKNANSAGVYGDGFTAISDYVHQSGGDGFKPGDNVLIEGNYVTQLSWYEPDAHADGVQIRGGSNIVIEGNYFDIPNGVANTKSNSALFLQLDASNVTFEGNWIRGGNYAIHAYSDLAGANPTIQIVGNTFYAGSTQYGFGSIGTGVVWLSNVTDTGLVALNTMK